MGGGAHGPIKNYPGVLGGVAAAPAGTPGPSPAPVPAPDGSPAGIAGAAAAFASNGDVPGDVQSSTLEDLDRRMRALDAARKFPAQDADGAQQMQGVGAQQATQMIQQMVSGIAGGIGGAIGGIMKPLTEIPQQAMQAGQGAIQPLMSALQQGHGAEGLVSDEHLADSLGGESGLGGGGAGGGGGIGAGGPGGGGGDGTVPAGYMGPPPVPASSPPTTPAGASAKSVTMTPTGGTGGAPGPTGMTGMPMVPPGAMGAGGAGESKEKPTEKRVTTPAVPNGQPVKGRLTPPPNVPVTKSGEDKPPVVTRSPRRIVIMPSDEEGKE